MDDTPFVYISEKRVRQLLDWDSTVGAIEEAFKAVSTKNAVQPPRTFTRLPNGNFLLTMPGFSRSSNKSTLACKLITGFSNNEHRNPPLPRLLANILLYKEETGELKSIVEGTEITAWRTVAASVIATKYLHVNPGGECDILAVLGAGVQGRLHAIAFQHFFKFKEIKVWNHRPEKAEKLVAELKQSELPVRFCQGGRECVQNADVVVTATNTSTPIVMFEWIKPESHINAIGAGLYHHAELDEKIYKNSTVYIDSWEGAKDELKGLFDAGVNIAGEVGEVLAGQVPAPKSGGITIFQSLGMAVEDVLMAEMIYNKHIATQ